MIDTKIIALQRAEILLKAAGVDYAIKLENGSVLGTLALAPTKTNGRATHKKVNNFVRDYDYITAMRKLSPGESLKWDMGSHDKAVSFQKVVSAAGSRLWGSESYITTQITNGSGVEVLRVC